MIPKLYVPIYISGDPNNVRRPAPHPEHGRRASPSRRTATASAATTPTASSSPATADGTPARTRTILRASAGTPRARWAVSSPSRRPRRSREDPGQVALRPSHQRHATTTNGGTDCATDANGNVHRHRATTARRRTPRAAAPTATGWRRPSPRAPRRSRPVPVSLRATGPWPAPETAATGGGRASGSGTDAGGD